MSTIFTGSKLITTSREGEDEDEESAESGSTSSFSLQECIDEFRTRRIRRVSTQSRDIQQQQQQQQQQPQPQSSVPEHKLLTDVCSNADAELINQNHSNKAQERKCKPCKNGFCYCFTSDSGDCASAPARDWHVRQPRRSRRSETNKNNSTEQHQRRNNLDGQRHQQQRHRHHSEPSNIRSISTKSTNGPFTALSSLHSVDDDAPLIHIIQELRDNCVVSEVRVNKQKLQSIQRKPIDNEMLQKLNENKGLTAPLNETNGFKPTAPALSDISEQETQAELTILEEESLKTEHQSSSHKSSRRSSGGKLLQKRLSQGHINFKPRDVKNPPPKPPRRSTQSLDGKFSLSSLTSTTASVREAERVLDEFLRKRGVELPLSNITAGNNFKGKRKSYPIAEIEKQNQKSTLPNCPSLSDIERILESKRGSHYAKNIRKTKVGDKPTKQITLGWTEPKISEMLNYDEFKLNKEQPKQFKTQGTQPAPQSAIGWQRPHKISLDTVDGTVSENLAINIEKKHTPIKYSRCNKKGYLHSSPRFIWGEQWRTFSPWKDSSKRLHQPSGLRVKSRNFLSNSKKKILRFVSPKKSNHLGTKRDTMCTVGVQTSHLDLNLLQSQSPPGSYHSPVQSLGTNTTSTTTPSNAQQEQIRPEPLLNSSETPDFDFKRKVKPPTPPKKVHRTQRARKLEFQDSCAPTTYRSYHKEFDHDVTITKMGYLLSSIRAKLEASDERAMRTFQECSRFAPLRAEEHNELDSCDGLDIPDSLRAAQPLHQEPIYSEIEEDCIRINSSPQYESKTAADLNMVASPTLSKSQASPKSQDLSALYATVQKPPKMSTSTKVTPIVKPTPLGQFLQESLKNGSFFQFVPLPDEPVTKSSASVDTLMPKAPTESAGMPHVEPSTVKQPLQRSLNNILERDSPPKCNRNLSKSDLSLHRSEIFLENLCRSEIVIHQHDNIGLEKTQNNCLGASSSAVSYDLPHEVNDGISTGYTIEDDTSSYATHGYELCESQNIETEVTIEPPPSENQSTPKNRTPRFTTKPAAPPIATLCIDTIEDQVSHPQNLSNSCPTTPHQELKPPKHTSHSLVELPIIPNSDTQALSQSALKRYRLLKEALRRSFRKSKNFFRQEKQRLAHSLSISNDQSNHAEGGELDISSTSSNYASLNLDSLMDESLSANEQLAQAVSICRQTPELEISSEMVEAERLLLFSSLRQQTHHFNAFPLDRLTSNMRMNKQCFFIDSMHLPVTADANQDIFFNYYYICTFECDGRIKSTHSVECQNGAALFHDCGIEFYSSSSADTLQLRCKIFMLRLRKVSTLSLEPRKSQLKRGSGSVGSAISTSSSSGDTIVSRFRLHGSFTVCAGDLVPYELVNNECQSISKLCLRASNSWQLPITTHTKSTNLCSHITLSGRIELRTPKINYKGYLNVLENTYNWNRRWCTLSDLHLCVWQHEANLTSLPPMITLPLKNCQKPPLTMAPREYCARARSFMLECSNGTDNIVYFAADTKEELDKWLIYLNEALTFVVRWLSGNSEQANV